MGRRPTSHRAGSRGPRAHAATRCASSGRAIRQRLASRRARGLAAAGALALALALGVPAASGAEPVAFAAGGFQVDVAPPDASFQCDATPEVQTSTGLQTQSGSVGPFVVGVHDGGDYPGRMRTGDDVDPAVSDTERLQSCASVTVEYELGAGDAPLACAETEVAYERDGAEVDALALDGVLLGTVSAQEGVVESHVLSAPGLQGPGVHRLQVAAMMRGGGDGVYEPRSLALTCTPLEAFVAVGGGLQEPDEPAGGRGKGKGLRDTTHVLAGELGVVHADGRVLGELGLLYRDALGDTPVHCRFMPGASGTTEVAMGEATLTGWEYVCNDGDPSAGVPATSGLADLVLVGRDGSGSAPMKGHGKHRGSVCVAADDAALSLGDCGAEDGLVDLDRGSAVVEGETSGDDGEDDEGGGLDTLPDGDTTLR